MRMREESRRIDEKEGNTHSEIFLQDVVCGGVVFIGHSEDMVRRIF
jgi:hypothetical protein